MGLHNGSAAINIDDEAREEIALAMDETERIVVAAHEVEAFSYLKSLRKAIEIEIGVDGGIVESKHSYGDAAKLEMTVSDETVVVGVNANKVAVGNAIVGTIDSAGEYPRVEPL